MNDCRRKNISCKTTVALLLCAAFLWTLPAQAQYARMKFRHINMEKGLSNSTIECIFQDSRGFMWFGTRDGLNRYDGYSMTVYKNITSDSTSISDNFIRHITEDRNHNLWIATNNGLNRLDISTNKFTRFKHNPRDPNTLGSNIVNYVYEDRKGMLWVCTNGGGLNLYNPKERSFTALQKNGRNSLGDNKVNWVLEDRRGNFWIGTETGLFQMNRENQSFYSFQCLGEPDKIEPNNKIRSIQEDLQGNLWLATESSGVLLFNTATRTFKKFTHRDTDPGSLGNNMIKCILVDSKGNLWVGTINGGLNLFNAATGGFLHYQNDPDDPTSLSQRTISAVLEDRDGNLWVGTHRGGINLYSPTAEKFSLYQQTSLPGSLSYNDVKAFCEDHAENLWIGTDGGGLNLFDRKKNTFTHYRHNPADSRSIGSDEVLHIMEDSGHNLWISTWGGGLNLFDRKTGSFTRFKNNVADKSSISSDYVQEALEDKRGQIWVATYYGGLNLFDPKTKTFRRITHGADGKTQLTGNNIVSLEMDKAGNLWIGTDDGGLNFYNQQTGRFAHYFTKDEKFPDLRVIFFDSKGRLWVGQSGLYLFDPQKNSFSIYTNKAGLSKEFIKGITEDEAGNFWISTGHGIVRFNPENLSYKTYNTGDGLQGLEFEANAYLKTKNGEMFFGGVNGFNRFFPQSITGNRHIPPVYITELQIFNKKILPDTKNSPLKEDISIAKEIRLSHTQSSISFSFAALNYTVPENNQYAYKLERFNSDWINAGPERKAIYTNLDPGEYIFRVKASNNDGVWNEQGTSIKIIITPPFWNTWWFLSIVFAMIVATAYMVLSHRRKSEIRKIVARKREELNQMQLQFFTNISHEVRTPLTLITGPLEKLMKEQPQPETHHYYRMMYKNAQRLLALINELMDFRKVEEGILKLRVMPGSLSAFLKEIAEEFNELAMQKHIRFDTKGLDRQEEVWFDRQVLEKIILNLLYNSFKYTAAEGQIGIELMPAMPGFSPKYKNQLVIKHEYRGKEYRFIRVWDTGVGIDKESIAHLFERYYRVSDTHLGSGIGLAFVKSLTTLHKGDIYVSSERKEGTEIIIGLPVGRHDYVAKEKWLESDKLNTRLESITADGPFDVAVDKAASSAVAEKQTPDKNCRILVVDDNDDLRNFLKESLEPYYTVSEAQNGQAGLAKAKEELPDLIISDVVMPVMDGIEFCRAVKENAGTSHIPFIMLTAKSTIASSIEGVESGADFYFAKPLNLDLLFLTIRNVFEQNKKLKDRFVKDYYSEAKENVHAARDKEFMDELLRIIDTQLVNPDLDIDYLCSQVGMSRTKLYQKIKHITGQSIGEFVRTIRLKKAAYIMTHEDVPLSEIMYRIGIQTQSYFTKAFKKEFGRTPTQFIQELKQ